VESESERLRYLRAVAESPWRFPSAPGFDEPPTEWAAAAWELDAVHRTITREMSRDVSKVGSVVWDTTLLARMSAALGTAQVVRLFAAIRDESPHREAEFRPAFESAFARHAPALPSVLSRADVLRKLQLDEETARVLLGESGE